MASSLIGAVENPRVVNFGINQPQNNTNWDLIRLKGPGLFIAAEIHKQGGTNNMTFIELVIDGRVLYKITYAALFNLGLNGGNNYGIQVHRGAVPEISTATIGLPVPLTYKKELLLRAAVKETGVVVLMANVICTDETGAPPSKAAAKKTVAKKTAAKKTGRK